MKKNLVVVLSFVCACAATPSYAYEYRYSPKASLEVDWSQVDDQEHAVFAPLKKPAAPETVIITAPDAAPAIVSTPVKLKMPEAAEQVATEPAKKQLDKPFFSVLQKIVPPSATVSEQKIPAPTPVVAATPAPAPTPTPAVVRKSEKVSLPPMPEPRPAETAAAPENNSGRISLPPSFPDEPRAAAPQPAPTAAAAEKPADVTPTPPAVVEKPIAITAPAATPADEKAPEVVPAPPDAPAAVPSMAVPSAADLMLEFEPASSTISPQMQPKLDSMVKQLTEAPALRLQIRAYAKGDDQGPSSARRMALSRGLMVRSYLTEKGIKPNRLDIRALGAETDRLPLDRVDLVFVR